jgi:acyl-CoA reductase-like NAD-dependent aldehyde dehydrogenase
VELQPLKTFRASTNQASLLTHEGRVVGVGTLPRGGAGSAIGAPAVILATGGIGLVRAAYSSGKPAFGVGPGNVPVFIERTADVPKAVQDILTGKCFDNGTICASEQAIVVDAPIEMAVREPRFADGTAALGMEHKVISTASLALPARISSEAL